MAARVTPALDLEAPFFPVQYSKWRRQMEKNMENSAVVGVPPGKPGSNLTGSLPETLKQPGEARQRGKGDVFYLSTDGHRVGFSLREAVIEHPQNCRFKGSNRDNRRTFHHWGLFLAYVEMCKLNIAQEVMDKLEGQYKQMRSHANY